jgi:predicted anti-sigma-YlaC factor YlaD
MNREPPKVPPSVEGASSVEVVVPEHLAPEEARALAPVKPKAEIPLITLTEDEQRQIEIDQRRALGELSIEEKTLLNQSLWEDIKARRKYARGIFRLICWWLAAILIVLVLQGFLSKRDIALNFNAFGSHWTTSFHFELAEGILLALIGGTTVTVIGLFVIVANYFFPRKSPPN